MIIANIITHVGILGHAAIYATLISLLICVISSVWHFKKPNNALLKQISTFSYTTHLTFLIAATAILLMLILQHRFEYAYVWKYTSIDLQLKYVISAFWAGQEGSFLIWAVLQGALGLMAMRYKGFNSAMLALLAFAQGTLTMLLLGLNLGDIHIGASPFALLKDLPENINNPIFSTPGYMRLIADGKGLNPLLQNFWMIIHPPILFLGYAAALMPFVLVIGSIISNSFKENINYIYKWGLIALIALGSGILVGGAWAYKALSFGGFWSWDPVENASLVPWLVLLACIHIIISFRKSGHHPFLAIILSILPYWLVLYASYLTRSGILSTTSVHAFGNNALSMQLIINLLCYAIIPITFISIYRKNIPTEPEVAPKFLSTTFILSTGSILLLLSAFQILFNTSIPVLNKLTSLNLALPINNTSFYNQWQTPFAIAIVLLISLHTIFIKHKTNNFKLKLIVSIINSLLFAFIISHSIEISSLSNKILLFFSLLSLITILITGIKNTADKIHIGFSIFIIGIIIPFSNPIELKQEQRMGILSPNITLEPNQLTNSGSYIIKYDKRIDSAESSYFNLKFYNNNDTSKALFMLEPYARLSNDMGIMYEPATKRYLHKDVFTYLTYINTTEPNESLGEPETRELLIGDSIHFRGYKINLHKVDAQYNKDSIDINNISLKALFSITDSNNKTLETSAIFSTKNGMIINPPTLAKGMNLEITFQNIIPDKPGIKLIIKQLKPDFISFKVTEYRFINVLWLGGFIMLVFGIWAVVKPNHSNKDSDIN